MSNFIEKEIVLLWLTSFRWADHLFSLDDTSVMSCRKENRIISDRRDPLKRFAIRFAKMIFIRASFPSISTLFVDFFTGRILSGLYGKILRLRTANTRFRDVRRVG